MISVVGKILFVLIFWPWRSQKLASQSTGKKEHEPTQPNDQFLRFVIFFCLFLRIAPGVWLSSAVIDIQEIVLIWVAFPVKHPNELSTRSIYMIANMISVIGKFVFLLIFGLRRSQ